MKIIITERQLRNLKIRRNISTELPKYITSTFKWLNPKAFGNFDEFLNRVIFSATRDYVGEFVEDPKDYGQLIYEFEPIVRKIVIDDYHDEILNYYTNHR